MDAAGAARGLLVDLATEEGEAKGVALAVEELYQHGGGIDGEGEFVGLVDIAVVFGGEEHGTALVDHQLATEVGLLFELLDIEAVGATIEMPVDVLCAFAGIVLTIVGELNGKTMERTFMLASDESFDHLAGIKVQRFVA